jgi:glycerol-1-phosphate dehydrogenase [NAD(P)+]
MEVQLTNQLGHNRPQEGSEQYFAYAIEAKLHTMGLDITYADMVGPGILISSVLHQQDSSGIRETLKKVGVRLDQLPRELMIQTLMELPAYVRQHQLPYSILHEISIDRARAEDVLIKAGL